MSSSTTRDSIVCGSILIGSRYDILLIVNTDHIVHLVLSLFSLGASPDDIRNAYVRNKNYQKPAFPVDKTLVEAMRDTEKFKQGLFKKENYSNYLAFFQEEIDAKGVGAVLKEYVFAGDERAESMMSRLFGGMIFHYEFTYLIHIRLIHDTLQVLSTLSFIWASGWNIINLPS